MFNLKQRKDPRQAMLDQRALELAMFMRWCESCGSGPISSTRCVEVAELILIRDKIDIRAAESLYVATVASAVSVENSDKARSITGFDGKIKAFCDQLGIDLPYKKSNRVGRSSTQEQLAFVPKTLNGDDLKITLARLKEAEYFRSDLRYQIQFLLPTLSDDMASKAGYACAIKLITAQYSKVPRNTWEENIVNMLMSSDDDFDAENALEICRRVEKSLEAWRATFTAFPAGNCHAPPEVSGHMPASETDTVYINAEAPSVTWLLIRGDSRYTINHWMLTLFFSIGAQSGWRVPVLVEYGADGACEIKLHSCRLDEYQAKNLLTILLSNMKTSSTGQDADTLQEIGSFIAFLRGGGFELRLLA